ncbi:hypothetical protein D1007_30755 [Hordeum vulgare]|nr:hypothetical protein D1007_30755 [Hordeum vulgare]
MEDDLEAAAAIASLASSGTADEARGKSRAPRKAVTPSKKKKELTSKERAIESAKRKGRSHVRDARDEEVAAVGIAAVAQQEDTNARVKAEMREALLYLGINPSQHGLVVVVAVDAASTSLSA